MAAAGGDLGSSVVEALSEGGTLAVVFLAVEVLATPEGSRFNWSTHPLLGLWPAAASCWCLLLLSGTYLAVLHLPGGAGGHLPLAAA